tara:strand:+ start:1375 stop:2544 length:1170 start_codon:yes stop_codon:yes gene_type:complete
MYVGWVGLGKCGKPIAEAIAEKLPVLAYDILPKDLQYAKFTDNPADLNSTDICFILVQTPNKTELGGAHPIDLSQELEDFDYTALCGVLETLDQISYPNAVVISSTVSPGTTKKLCKSFPNLDIIYMPVMIHVGKAAETYLNSPLYYIGTHNSTPRPQLEEFLTTVTNTSDIITGTYDEVEMYKMMGNLFCSLKIAFSNNISDMIEQLNLDASSFNILQALKKDTVRFNSTMYMSPGSGDGGPCHPRDGVVLSHLSKSTNTNFAESIAQAREDQARNLAQYLCSFDLPIVILGKSFRANIDLTDGSYSVLVGEYAGRLHPDALILYDTDFEQTPCLVLVTHLDQRMLSRHKFHADSVVVDLWGQQLDHSEKYTVKVYGDRRVSAETKKV